MRYLLDTNVIVALSRGNFGLERRIRREDPTEIGMSVIVLHELYFGAYKGRRIEANLGTIAELEFDVLDFDREDARHAGEIRASLAAIGRPIGPYDVLIAGQAMARNMTLITHNVREFARVTGLRIEDWES